MTVEKIKEKCDVPEKLDNILKNKKADFIENIFPKYTLTEKSNYIEKIRLIEPDLNVYKVTVFIIIFGSFVVSLINLLVFSDQIHVINALLFFMTSIFFTFMYKMTFFQKITSKKWLKEEKNRDTLQSEMFLDYAVDKETMKYVVQCYGKEHFVKLMKGKENLKYKDVFLYVQQLDSESAETEKLSKVAECLLN